MIRKNNIIDYYNDDEQNVVNVSIHVMLKFSSLANRVSYLKLLREVKIKLDHINRCL